MRVGREKLLGVLESVSAGLAKRETVEQSSCVVFRDGKAVTYNDEIMCVRKCPIGIEGAVAAQPLLSLLGKLSDDAVDISAGDAELRVTAGKRKRGGIRMEAQIILPVEGVEEPGNWRELPEEWVEAVDLVRHCTSTDEDKFAQTCVRITGAHVEATDNYQLARYPVRLGIKGAFLISRASARHIAQLGMDSIALTPNWVHFKNSAHLRMSCRRYADEEFPDLDPHLKQRGSPLTLPGGLKEALDKAEIFSNEAADYNVVTVELRPGKMRITGMGATGWYAEQKKVGFTGKPVAFVISPKMLAEIASRHNECEITKAIMRVDTGKMVYLTCLGAPAAEEEAEDAEEQPRKKKKGKPAAERQEEPEYDAEGNEIPF